VSSGVLIYLSRWCYCHDRVPIARYHIWACAVGHLRLTGPPVAGMQHLGALVCILPAAAPAAASPTADTLVLPHAVTSIAWLPEVVAIMCYPCYCCHPLSTHPTPPPQVMMLSTCRGGPADAALIRRVNEKMDIWSLGVCLFELAAGERTGQGQGGSRSWLSAYAFIFVAVCHRGKGQQQYIAWQADSCNPPG
jgi:hypothetical protein